MACLVAAPARAHDAFGDLGPFYASLLHPLADPSQTVLLAGFAVLLARQPHDTVRRGYGLHAATAALTVGVLAIAALPTPPAWSMGLAAALLGLASLLGQRLPATLVLVFGVAAAVLAGLAGERPEGLRQALLATLGAGLGLATAALLLWSAFDLLRHRLGEIACAVVGSWVAAIGIMTAAVPR